MTSMTNSIEAVSSAQTQNNDAPLIKTDRLGRIRISPEHRQMLLDKFEESTISGLAFAKMHGIKYPTFANWCQKRKRETNSYPEAADSHDLKLMESLTEVITRESPEHSLKVQFGTGIELSIFNDAQLSLAAKLIRKLQSDVS